MTDTLASVAHDLTDAPVKVQRDALAITEHAAVNVKRDWQDNARRSAGHYAPAYPASISYDLKVGAALAGNIEVEVGPDKSKRQGALGNILEYGSVNNPPHNDGGRALANEAPRYEVELAKATLGALGWR